MLGVDNSSNATIAALSDDDTNNWAALILSLFILLGVFGNTLVCIAVSTDRRLQNVTNYFLLSLAVADLLVCTSVMPLSIATVFHNGSWYFGFTLCAVHCYTDVFLCSASIVHMTAISLDRYLGISRPLKQRNKSKLVVFLKIFIVWILTIIISCPLAVLFLLNPTNIYDVDQYLCQINNRYYMVYGSTLAFIIPFLIMVVTYVRTTNLLKQQAILCSGAVAAAANNKRPEGLRRTRTKRVSTANAKKRFSFKHGLGEEDELTSTLDNISFNDLTFLDTSSAVDLERHSLSNDRPMSPSPHFAKKASSAQSTPLIGRRKTSSPPHLRHSSSTRVTRPADDCRRFLLHSDDKRVLTQRSASSSNFKLKLKFLQRPNFADANGKSSSTAAADVANEQKATRVLGLVFACFFVCWTPFFALNFTYAFCPHQCQAPFLVEMTFLWLGFVSSMINPVIYTVFNKKFRQAFSRIVRCRCKRQRRNRSFDAAYVLNNPSHQTQQKYVASQRNNSQLKRNNTPKSSVVVSTTGATDSACYLSESIYVTSSQPSAVTRVINCSSSA